MLLSGKNQAEIAEEIGLSKRTICRYIASDEFKREFKAACDYQIYNPAAVIYPEAWSTIDTAIHEKRPTLVSVDGEEDLLGFPAVLLAPEDAVVLYGQPDVGIIWVPVTIENKVLARELLEQMPRIE